MSGTPKNALGPQQVQLGRAASTLSSTRAFWEWAAATAHAAAEMLSGQPPITTTSVVRTVSRGRAALRIDSQPAEKGASSDLP